MVLTLFVACFSLCFSPSLSLVYTLHMTTNVFFQSFFLKLFAIVTDSVSTLLLVLSLACLYLPPPSPRLVSYTHLACNIWVFLFFFKVTFQVKDFTF